MTDTPIINDTTERIELTYRTTGAPIGAPEYTVQLDYLVIACEPNALCDRCDYSPLEKTIFGKFENFTFHTTLLKVKVNKENPAHYGVIFAPSILETMSGKVYGYRNETAKALSAGTENPIDTAEPHLKADSIDPAVAAANELAYNYVTVYQIVRTKDAPSDPSKFKQWIDELMRQGLSDDVNWCYGTDFEILDHVTTPYFDHFTDADLKNYLPWKYLGIQGKRNTIFVHASTCFESVLDIYQYIQMLLTDDANKIGLPTDKTAAIGILGAGPSGLMFGSVLRDMEYTNVTIYEKSGRIGGKTHTIKKLQMRKDGSELNVICELGTCYLSPAYDHFVKDMSRFRQGNDRIGFGGAGGMFRGIMTKDQLGPDPNPHGVIPYGAYIIRKAAMELGAPDAPPQKIISTMERDLTRYIALREDLLGHHTPMPMVPPRKLFNEKSSQSFLDFLSEERPDGGNLTSLIGLLQYGYSVQGYGTLKNIPAYYGLIWVSTRVAQAIIDAFKDPKINVVTAWSEGWGNLWEQMATPRPDTGLTPLNVQFSVDTVRIVRPS